MGLKDYFGKNEGAAVAFVCGVLALIVIIAMASYYLPSGSTYETITVSYAQEGQNLLITENHLQDLKGEYFNVIYRSFGEQVCKEGESCNIQLRSIRCSKGAPYYSKKASVATDLTSGDRIDVGPYTFKIKANEVGCFDKEEFTTIKADLSVEYLVPQSHVELNKNKHILFSEDHFYIRTLNVESLGGSTQTNNIPANTDISIMTSDGNTSVGGIKFIVALILSLILVSTPFFIWKWMGTEKHFVVPAYMHTIPNKNRSAWEVDILTNGTGELSKNGMASILMELYARKIITIKEEKKFITKKTLWLVAKKRNTEGLSTKAQEFLNELLRNKEGEDAQNDICEIHTSSTSFTSFIKGFYKGSDIVRVQHEFFDNKASVLYAIMSTIFFVFIYAARAFIDGGTIIIVFALIIAILVMSKIIPKSVFTRFKGDYYKNYLEWMAFKKMLQDYAQMKKYFKEDSVMWKEWLIYATALGAADNVLKQLKELKLLNPQDYENTRLAHSYMIAWAVTSYGSAHPKSSGSGSIGGGGGFGGGGGGGR